MPFRSVLLFAITLTVLLFSLVGSRAAAQAPLRFDDGFTTYDLIDYESRVDGVPTWEGYQISANLRVWGSAGRHSIFHVVFLDGTTQVGEVRCQASTQAGTPDYHYETRCTAAFQAPEVLAGEVATPIADYVAILIAARSLTSFCDISEITKRVLSAAVSPRNVELYETVRFFESRFISEPPAFRPPMEVGIQKSERLREILGTSLDPEGLTRTIADLLDERPPVEEAGRVTIAGDGSTLVLPSGTKHTLGRAHRQILRLLLQAHRANPERRLDVWELLEAGWPGEDPIPEAGTNRVYVALARLRQQGLRDVIEHNEGGYRLRPGGPFRIAGLFG